jgi:prolipoprotein diacylglyceryltransferase
VRETAARILHEAARPGTTRLVRGSAAPVACCVDGFGCRAPRFGGRIHFPLSVPIGPWRLPAHPLFEAFAYFAGFRLYVATRRAWGDAIADATRWSVIAAAAVGAAAGSKILVWLDDPMRTWAERGDVGLLLGGKTIVGGLVGGWIAVEWMKRRIGERRATGDLFVLPLCLGIAIGRVGCFFAGLDDHTYGVATALPWGVDFGDGVRRHPTQLYEIVALAAIAIWALARRPRVAEPGDLFKGFMALYAAFRLALEAIKPEARPYAGLSGIQVACTAVLLYLLPRLARIFAATREAPRV